MKYYLLTILSLFLLVSCTQETLDVELPVSDIRFTTSVFDTRAGQLWSQDGANDGWHATDPVAQVGIYAYRQGFIQPFMGDDTAPLLLTRSGADWGYGTPREWPGGTVDFYGYAPVNATGLTVATDEHPIHPLVFETQTKPEDQVDLLLAIPNKGLQGGSVTMFFRHALAKILFAARLHDDLPANWSVIIDEITLTGVYLKGTRASIEADVVKSDNGWTVLTGTTDPVHDFVLSRTGGYLADRLIEKGGTYPLSTRKGALLILPQPINDSHQVRLKYRILINKVLDAEHDETIKINDFSNQLAWRHNEKTIYTILFYSGGVQLSVFGLPGSPGE